MGIGSGGNSSHDEPSKSLPTKPGFNFLSNLHSIQQSFLKEGLFSKPPSSFYEAPTHAYDFLQRNEEEEGDLEESGSSKTPEFR